MDYRYEVDQPLTLPRGVDNFQPLLRTPDMKKVVNACHRP